jgi:hypothetical protein
MEAYGGGSGNGSERGLGQGPSSQNEICDSYKNSGMAQTGADMKTEDQIIESLRILQNSDCVGPKLLDPSQILGLLPKREQQFFEYLDDLFWKLMTPATAMFLILVLFLPEGIGEVGLDQSLFFLDYAVQVEFGIEVLDGGM